jgi:hypothetical protein
MNLIERRADFLINFAKTNFSLNPGYVQAVKMGATCGLAVLVFLIFILVSL